MAETFGAPVRVAQQSSCKPTDSATFWQLIVELVTVRCSRLIQTQAVCPRKNSKTVDATAFRLAFASSHKVFAVGPEVRQKARYITREDQVPAAASLA